MIFKFISYDIKEGTIKYLGKFFIVIVLTIISCIILDKKTEFVTDIFNQHWGFAESCLDIFSGRYPFKFEWDSVERFELPFTWFLIFFFLAYCIGDYLNKDMHGFGMQMMVHSRKYSTWWISKCIWSIFTTVLYFAFIYASVLGYSWVKYGEISNERHYLMYEMRFGSGNKFQNITTERLMFLIILMPVMVGILQTLLQIIMSMFFDATKNMTVIGGILIISCYYGNPFLPHGYAMVYRYFSDGSGTKVLEEAFGIKYLAILIFILFIVGYFILRRKDILEKNN